MKKNRPLSTILFFLTLIIIYNHSLNAQSCNLISENIKLGGPSHDAGFQENNATNSTATLSNGNFVIAWETRDDVDGVGNGGFFQVFDEAGTAVTNVTIPYADINPTGVGDQGTSGPRVVALNSGFVIVWTSEDGPGDTGPVGGEQQDVYFRTYNNDGTAVNASTRISINEAEDKLSFVLPLNTGGFVILTHIDEDNTENKDNYFVSAYDASGVSTSGGLINISGGAHDAAFQSTDQASALIDLGGGNFVVAWETRDNIDGDGNGGFFRIFNANGTAITDVVLPYADINPAGTGDQGTPGPKVMSLANGNFVIAWESEQGPGDIGPAADDMQDIYFRIYSANGTAVTGTTKANSDNTAEEEQFTGMIELTGGNFAMLYSRDEDDTGNNDDYFIRTFTAAGIPAGSSFEISSDAHLNNFSTVNSGNRGMIALNNGNFAVGWASRDDSDGDDAGAYYRVFNPNGDAVSPVVFPYQDINAEGTGKQSSFGPILKTLPDGFTVVWQSAEGPGDVGPPLDEQQDVYHRVIDNNGNPLCGTTKTNSGNDAGEEVLLVVEALANGNFVVVYKDDEDDTGNTDDYFFRVIGGAPLQILCPTLGSASVSTSSVCVDAAFDITVMGLQNMAATDNNERDYGMRFVAFANATGNPYSGGNVLGTVPFGNLSNGGTTAALTGISINTADPDLFIYAILDANPSDGTCLPNAQSMIEIVAPPTVAFTALADLCIDAGMQNGLGGGTPLGGTYSGTGVTDNGNGMTYSFNPSVAGTGSHTLSYTFTNATGCGGSASDAVEVFALPTVTFTSPGSFDIGAGVQTALGGGSPAGGIYSGTGVTDNGNGTFSFNPMTAGVGDATVNYNYTDANGCSGNAMAIISVTASSTGDVCNDANDISNLFGQALGVPQISSVWDNTNYTSVGDPTSGYDCFADNQAITNTIWYSFVGDGNIYRIKTLNCNGVTNYLPNGDTQMAIYSGACDNLTPVACNDDEDVDNAIYNVNLENFSTEAGVTYFIIMDSYNGDKGEFCIEVTMEAVTATKNISSTGIEIFPNPTNGILYLKNVAARQVKVFDNLGRMVLSFHNPGNQMNISNLTTGIYSLKIYAGEDIYTARVIKE